MGKKRQGETDGQRNEKATNIKCVSFSCDTAIITNNREDEAKEALVPTRNIS